MNGLMLLAFIILGYLTYKSFLTPEPSGKIRQSLPKKRYQSNITLNLKEGSNLFTHFLEFSLVYSGYMALNTIRFIGGFFIKGHYPPPYDSLIKLLD
jgi:hypothetical protein